MCKQNCHHTIGKTERINIHYVLKRSVKTLETLVNSYIIILFKRQKETEAEKDRQEGKLSYDLLYFQQEIVHKLNILNLFVAVFQRSIPCTVVCCNILVNLCGAVLQ